MTRRGWLGLPARLPTRAEAERRETMRCDEEGASQARLADGSGAVFFRMDGAMGTSKQAKQSRARGDKIFRAADEKQRRPDFRRSSRSRRRRFRPRAVACR